MAILIPPKAPNLPLATPEYARSFQDQFANVLRLYFNQLDNAIGAVLGPQGRQYLSTPHAAVSRITNQTAALANTEYQIDFNTADLLNGVTLDVDGGLEVSASGVYNYQFSLQLVSTDSSLHDVAIWLKANGTTIANTASYYTVHEKHGAVNGHLVAAVNFFVELNAGDVVSLWWTTTTTNVSLEALAATGPVPLSPSAVATLSFVST
jgi:hypothetical protein